MDDQYVPRKKYQSIDVARIAQEILMADFDFLHFDCGDSRHQQKLLTIDSRLLRG